MSLLAKIIGGSKKFYRLAGHFYRLFFFFFLSIISIMSVSNSMRRIIAQSCHYFNADYLTKWKVVTTSLKSRKELVKVLRLPIKLKNFFR